MSCKEFCRETGEGDAKEDKICTNLFSDINQRSLSSACAQTLLTALIYRPMYIQLFPNPYSNFAGHGSINVITDCDEHCDKSSMGSKLTNCELCSLHVIILHPCFVKRLSI